MPGDFGATGPVALGTWRLATNGTTSEQRCLITFNAGRLSKLKVQAACFRAIQHRKQFEGVLNSVPKLRTI